MVPLVFGVCCVLLVGSVGCGATAAFSSSASTASSGAFGSPAHGALTKVEVPQYRGCIQGYYGPSCGGTCNCGPNEDCDDGPTGFGICTCMQGRYCSNTPEASPLPTSLTFLPTSAVDRSVSISSTGDGASATATLAALDVDAETARRPRQVIFGHVSRVNPMPYRSLSDTRIVVVDPDVATMLGIPQRNVSNPHIGRTNRGGEEGGGGGDYPPWLLHVMSGAVLAEGSAPFAHRYGGHQFGSWGGQLGDGRAISIGNVYAQRASRNAGGGGDGNSGAAAPPSSVVEISLKGSGRTPYSRSGDGRAVLVSALREFLGAAALTAIGIPSVRSLCVVAGSTTYDGVFRDEFYDGGTCMLTQMLH